MNCEEFKLAVGAHPATTQRDVLEHVASCATCAQYRGDMIAMDGLIHRALQIEVATTSRVRPSVMNWRIAATILVAVIVFSLGWLAYPRASLADQIVAHALHEADTIVRTDERVAREHVKEVLNSAGVSLAEDQLAVSFAMVCPVRKREVPHLVVQTEDGPVTVLVLADERAITAPQRFEERGFVGTLVPAPRGVIAVLARGEGVDEVAATVLKALRYEAPSGPNPSR